MTDNNDTLLEFPCDFPIKIMGKHCEEFEPAMLAIVRRHAPELQADQVKTRPSSQGTYLAITITIRAHSKQQLDNIYQEISSHELVSMAL